MTARTWLGLVGAAVLAGWTLAPDLPGSMTLVQPRREIWSPASLPRRVDASALAAQVAGAPFWGPLGAASSAPIPPPEPAWRVAGVFGQGAGRILLVSFAGDARPPVRLMVGDKLPSGQRITRIGNRDYCVSIDGKEFRMGIERSDS